MSPSDDMPHRRRKGLTSLGQVMDGVIEGLGLKSQLELGRLARDWSDIVGPDASSHTQPLSIESGTLKIAARESAWSQNLVLYQREIIKRIGNQFPLLRVRKLKFVVDPNMTPTRAEAEPKAEPAPEKRDLPLSPELEEMLQDVEDPKLRRAVEKVMRITRTVE